MRSVRTNRHNCQNDSDGANRDPDTLSERVLRMIMLCMNFNFSHVRPAKSKKSAILS